MCRYKFVPYIAARILSDGAPLPKSNMRLQPPVLFDLNQQANVIPDVPVANVGILKYCDDAAFRTSAPLPVIDALMLVEAPFTNVALNAADSDPMFRILVPYLLSKPNEYRRYGAAKMGIN